MYVVDHLPVTSLMQLWGVCSKGPPLCTDYLIIYMNRMNELQGAKDTLRMMAGALSASGGMIEARDVKELLAIANAKETRIRTATAATATTRVVLSRSSAARSSHNSSPSSIGDQDQQRWQQQQLVSKEADHKVAEAVSAAYSVLRDEDLPLILAQLNLMLAAFGDYPGRYSDHVFQDDIVRSVCM